MKSNKSESVKVAVRVRPMNKKERDEQSVICVEVDSASNAVSIAKPKSEMRTFQFDYVYPISSTQKEIYDQVAFPIVESIFQGYNGTIFAYGQTGCGKTFTMMGNAETRGIIPNAFQHIFGFINTEGLSRKFLLRCSFLEIYNEEVRDLLGKDPNKALEVREDKKKGTYVKDLSYTPLKFQEEIAVCLDKGNTNKHVGVTSMNEKSSRSHSLFTVYLEIEEGNEKNTKIKSGKLNLVDLAGSERVGKTNAKGQTLDEGKKINLSLTALGSVIDSLSSNRKFIPYKDSKLTRLLSDSLGGNTKTVMFANVSPASFNFEETLGTLRYASRAKLIKNNPKVNEDPKDTLLRQYEDEIKLLKQQLEGRMLISPRQNHIHKNEEDKENESYSEQNGKSNQQEEDLNEKQFLLDKIDLLEKEMIAKQSLESEGNQIKHGDINEGKNDEFRQYRLQQLKNVDKMEKKIALLQEEKRKEEEALLNDVTKLKNCIKYLKSEIEDLKYDNEKDRIDFIENIKNVNRENLLYKGIIKFLLSDHELKRIIEACRYNEENGEWKIHPFHFREKYLKFPNVCPYQIPDFIDNELSKREMVFSDDHKHKRQINLKKNSLTEQQKKGLYDIRSHESNYSSLNQLNYANERDGNNNSNNGYIKNCIHEEPMKFNNQNSERMNNNYYAEINKRTSNDKVTLISNKHHELANRIDNGMNGGNKSNENNMMTKREKERYDEALNYNSRFNSFRNNNKSNGTQSSINSNGFLSPNPILKPVKKGKMILDPISNHHQHSMNKSNNNNLEVSFKATLEISDSKGNKINIAPGVNLNIGKKSKLMLEQISENEIINQNNNDM